MKEIDRVIGANLKRMRESRGLSQPELGSMLGVDKSKISGWENGHVVLGKEWMQRICDTLEVRYYEFYLEPDTPIVRGEREREYLELSREADAFHVDEEIKNFARFRIEQEKKKEELKESGQPQLQHLKKP